MNTQTPEELEAQTIKAYAAWRKDKGTKVELLNGSEWIEANEPIWSRLNHYRIKPEPPKPVEVEVWWHENKSTVLVYQSFDNKVAYFTNGWVRATATIKVKEGE